MRKFSNGTGNITYLQKWEHLKGKADVRNQKTRSEEGWLLATLAMEWSNPIFQVVRVLENLCSLQAFSFRLEECQNCIDWATGQSSQDFDGRVPPLQPKRGSPEKDSQQGYNIRQLGPNYPQTWALSKITFPLVERSVFFDFMTATNNHRAWFGYDWITLPISLANCLYTSVLRCPILDTTWGKAVNHCRSGQWGKGNIVRDLQPCKLGKLW